MSNICKSMFDFCMPVLDENGLFIGCAFKWSNGQFVTCKHVIEEANTNLKLVLNFGSENIKYVNPRDTKTSKSYDLGMIYVEEDEQLLLEHHKYEGALPLGVDIALFGFTQSKLANRLIEPRCIKSYVHRSAARSETQHINEGIIEVNEINMPIPKGFSGGPIITLQSKLVGMSLGTNLVEKPLYKFEEERVIERNNDQNTRMEIVEKYSVEHYGLFHSIKNIQDIIENYL